MAERRSPAAGRSKPPATRYAQAHRLTLRVPQADASVIEWWQAQDDPSASLRSLIREEIQRNGFTDTINRPVQQGPRRGRPPAGGYESYENELEQEPPAAAQPAAPAPARTAPVTPAPAPAPARPAPAPVAVPAATTRPARPAPEPASPAPAREPVSVGASAPATSAAPFSLEDDFFGHGS